MFLLPIKP